jgi:hypothetical protein
VIRARSSFIRSARESRLGAERERRKKSSTGPVACLALPRLFVRDASLTHEAIRIDNKVLSGYLINHIRHQHGLDMHSYFITRKLEITSRKRGPNHIRFLQRGWKVETTSHLGGFDLNEKH